MIKKTWYYLFRAYVKLGLFFTMKRIVVYGRENIPKKGALLFIGNHQNGLIDAILIPTTTDREIHFLARASAFRKKFVSKLLSTINMIPVYRLRDGYNTIEKNKSIFTRCVNILKENGAVEIFAEGEHHLSRRIIPLKKGFARILLETFQKHPNLDVHIVPVGLNYDSRLNFPSQVSIYYDKPIHANKYFDMKNPDMTFSDIVKVVSKTLKKLTLHVESRNYPEAIEKLEAAGVDYLNPFKANKLAKKLKDLKIKSRRKKKNINWWLPLQFLGKINSIVPFLIWRYLKGTIKEIIFTNTFRFAVITTLFPLFYLIQAGIVNYYFGLNYAIGYLIVSIALGIVVTKTTPVSRELPLE